jgi:hypothetical protein
MYVQNATLRRVRGCFREKAISITYSEAMFEALSIQHAMRMRHIVICGLPGSKIFYRIFYKQHKNIIGHEMLVLILSTTVIGDISNSKTHWARYDQQSILVFM